MSDQKLVNAMKKKSFTQSAFFNLRALTGLLLCAATACLIFIPTRSGLAFLHPQASSNASQRTLTFEERVAYQRAIEDVYWRHRIWPKDRSDPKPSLDAVMSQAQLEKKVADYLHNSQALEDYWQRPITAEQLQAEMDRMATHTKQPEVLQELFDALGNDPFVIAECLARPLLAERSLPEVYAHDRTLSSDSKRPWVGSAKTQVAIKMAAVSRPTYTLPVIAAPAGACTDDTWAATSITNAPAARLVHTAVWTGSEMIIWGGASDANYLGTGGRYNPSTDSWTATTTINAPAARELHTAVWAGSEMIIWGGYNGGPPLNDGGRYNPSTDTWTATSTSNAPEGREWHTSVWAGNEMIVWGGLGNSGFLNTGGRYNPSTDSWTATSTVNAPTARQYHTAIWTDSEMIVWGGCSELGCLEVLLTGGRYNPTADSWTATNTTNAPAPRGAHTAVWTGSKMIVWGGEDIGLYLNTGGAYNPSTDNWTATTQTDAPSARERHTAVWIGGEMIVWGGTGITGEENTGGRYNPGTNSWTATSTTNAPAGRAFHTAVWTDSQMIVWGGSSSPSFNTGGKYCATAPAGTPTPTPTASQTPTPTPTPAPVGCDSGIVFNGGFETGHFEGWAIFDPGNPEPFVTNDHRHSGNYSAFAGGSFSQFCGNGAEPSGDSSFFQSFTVPVDGGTLSFWHWDCTTDDIASDWQDAYITDGNGNILQTIFHQCENGQTWLNATADMTAYAGMTVGIRFLVHQDGLGNLTGMYVDDVALYVPCATPTPTPTATATPTASATATPTTSPTPTVTPRVTPRPRPTPHARPTPT